MRGNETVAMEKSWSGVDPKYCRTAIERCVDTSNGRSWTYGTNRDGTDTLRLAEAFRRAGYRPHRPRMLALGGGTRVDSQGFQLSNAWGRVSSQGGVCASHTTQPGPNLCLTAQHCRHINPVGEGPTFDE